MLTAGDESGRTQRGNNNAYAQDNPLTWLDWDGRDRELEAFTAGLAALRRAHPALADPVLLSGRSGAEGIPDVAWLTAAGSEKTAADWEAGHGMALIMLLGRGGDGRLAVLFNRSAHEVAFRLPARRGHRWEGAPGGRVTLGARTVAFVAELPGGRAPSKATAP
jgi:glycogen debranching enzyme